MMCVVVFFFFSCYHRLCEGGWREKSDALFLLMFASSRRACVW